MALNITTNGGGGAPPYTWVPGGALIPGTGASVSDAGVSVTANNDRAIGAVHDLESLGWSGPLVVKLLAAPVSNASATLWVAVQTADFNLGESAFAGSATTFRDNDSYAFPTNASGAPQEYTMTWTPPGKRFVIPVFVKNDVTGSALRLLGYSIGPA